MFRELDVEITVTEILEAIKVLKTSKSVGPDKLSYYLQCVSAIFSLCQ